MLRVEPHISVMKSFLYKYTLEPTRSMAEALAVEIQNVVNVLLASHQIKPKDGELVDNLGNGYVCLQGWVFVQGFASVKESS